MAQDYDAIRVTPEAKADAQDAKEKDETWSDYVRRCAANPPQTVEVADIEQIKNELSMANEPGVEVDVESLYEKLDRIENAVKEATDTAQRVEKTMEELND